MRIGELAQASGTPVETIRFYEREGLLAPPERVGGQRRYEKAAIRRLATIDIAQRAGFSLAEIRVLLTSIDEGAPAHEQLQALAARKLPEVDALIDRAKAMREWLSAATACGCETIEACLLFSGGLDSP